MLLTTHVPDIILKVNNKIENCSRMVVLGYGIWFEGYLASDLWRSGGPVGSSPSLLDILPSIAY